MTVSIWQDKSSEIVRHSDVVVVGAGLVGCAIAREANRLGRSVTILESSTIAAGATGRNTGFCLSGLCHSYLNTIKRHGLDTAKALRALAEQNRQEILSISKRHELPVDKCGSWLMAVNSSQLDEIESTANSLALEGLNIKLITHDNFNRNFTGGLFWEDDLGVDPVRITQALYRESNAVLYDTCEVFDMTSEPDYVTIYARRGTFHARHVFLATNAYTPLIEPEINFIKPVRGQVIATNPLPQIFSSLGYADDGYYYFRQLSDGRLLLGGGRRDFVDQEYTYSDHTSENVQKALEHFLEAHFPEAVGNISRRWSGIMAFSPDELPIIGHLSRDPRVSYATGFSGHGLALGIVVARNIVSTALYGTPLGLFSSERLN